MRQPVTGMTHGGIPDLLFPVVDLGFGIAHAFRELVEHFLGLVADEYGSKPKAIQEAALKELQKLEWTGNIRELRNVVERLLILGGAEITEEDVKLFASK